MSISQLFQTGEQSRQKGHFRNLVLLAKIDGELVQKESQLLERIAKRISITPEQAKEIVKNANDFPSIPPASREERYERLIQLCQVAQADGKVDLAEGNLLHKFAMELGFTEESYQANYPLIMDHIIQGKSKDEILDILLGS